MNKIRYFDSVCNIIFALFYRLSKSIILSIIFALSFGINSYNVLVVEASAITTPITVSSQNSHYFTDSSGKDIVLSGLPAFRFAEKNATQAQYRAEVDNLLGDPSTVIDDGNYLRLWTALPWSDKGTVRFPWREINDYAGGSYSFNLQEWDSVYWTRVKDLIGYAQEKGVYVGFIIFDECGLEGSRGGSDKTATWRNHPFYGPNNINSTGLNTDTAIPASGTSFYGPWGANTTLERLQKAYITKIFTELKDYNNILWEPINEFERGSQAWEDDVVSYMKSELSRIEAKSTLLFSNHIIGSVPPPWNNSNFSGWNFHKTTNKDSSGQYTPGFIQPLAELMRDYYPHNMPINNNESSHKSKFADLRKNGMGMFILGGHFAYDDAEDTNASGTAIDEMKPHIAHFNKFVKGITVPRDGRQGVWFQYMMPNNEHYNNGTVYVPNSPTFKSYSLVNPGWEYAILLDGSGGDGGSMGINLSGLQKGWSYEAVAYKTDPGVNPAVIDLEVNYNEANSTITGLPGFGSSLMVYIRAVNDFTITKASSKQTVTKGEIFSYTITVRNNQRVDKSGMMITDQLDPSLEYISSDNGGSFSNPTVRWENITVPANSEKAFVLSVKAR